LLKFEGVLHRRFLLGQVLWFLFWLTVTVVAALVPPDAGGHGTHQRLGLPPCAMPLLFHRLCPGCGLTTSFSALLHGDFALAWRAHLFGPLLYALFTATAIISAIAYAKKRRWNLNSERFVWGLGLIVCAYVGYGFWRMAAFKLEPYPATNLDRQARHVATP
jgi:hypothetical protein